MFARYVSSNRKTYTSYMNFQNKMLQLLNNHTYQKKKITYIMNNCIMIDNIQIGYFFFDNKTKTYRCYVNVDKIITICDYWKETDIKLLKNFAETRY